MFMVSSFLGCISVWQLAKRLNRQFEDGFAITSLPQDYAKSRPDGVNDPVALLSFNPSVILVFRGSPQQFLERSETSISRVFVQEIRTSFTS
jgi:hypothetical protein